MIPTPGRIVLYTLNEYDAESINKRRKDFAAYRETDDYRDTGYIAHYGNGANAGDVLPAIIIRPWGDTESASANLKVLLDGTDTYWATSRGQGDEPGQWHQPPRV